MCADPIQPVIDALGLGVLAKELKVSGQAIRKWQAHGRMPRTEWTGETSYSETIERLMGGRVTKAQLLTRWEPVAPPAAKGGAEAQAAAHSHAA